MFKLFADLFGGAFYTGRSYHGRSFAPRKSTPSVSIASASGRTHNLVVPGSTVFGQEKVPLSKRFVSTHKPVPSQ
jgi:hypothetical protein